MTNTIKQNVLDYLKANYPTTASNGTIAQALAIPEPSVRRATLQLEKTTRIHFSETGPRGSLLWQANGQ